MTHNISHHKQMNTKKQWEQDLEGVKKQLAHMKMTWERTMVSSDGNGAHKKQMKGLLHTQVAPLLTLYVYTDNTWP